PWNGVIGMKKESALDRFLTGRPAPYEVANGEAVLQGAIVDIDDQTGRARSILRVRERVGE
ncbi:MAG: YmdB family metallophosphoesterase, partial [Myxococcales bacterium]